MTDALDVMRDAQEAGTRRCPCGQQLTKVQPYYCSIECVYIYPRPEGGEQ